MRQRVILALTKAVLASKDGAASHQRQVLNMASNDVRRLDDTSPWWIFLWAGPLELAAMLAAVSLRISLPAALAGAGCLLLLFPLQIVLSNTIKGLRIRASSHADRRIGATSEAIDGILTIKMLSMEASVSESVAALRATEAGSGGQKLALIRACNFLVSFIVLPLASFATFATASAQGIDFQAADVFFTLCMLQLPQQSMATFFVRSVQSYAELMASLDRMAPLLASKDRTPVPDRRDPPQERVASVDGLTERSHEHMSSVETQQQEVVAMQGGCYSWVAMQPVRISGVQEDSRRSLPALSGVNLSVRLGELVCVCGEVGAGKSTLFAALLGDSNLRMRPCAEDTDKQCTCYLAESVAYCAQTPWIFPGTIKENIVLGHAVDAAWYAKVLSACHLDSDLQQLSEGDMTQLADRGSDMSGGQCARIALARAAYSRASVMLLDDPLSALNGSVANHVYNSVIGRNGIMKGSAILLATHHTHFLRDCSKVLYLHEGRALAFAPFQKLPPEILQIMPTSVDRSSLPGPLRVLDTVTSARMACLEGKAKGDVSWQVYGRYALLYGWAGCLIILASSVFGQAAYLGSQYWLSLWTTAPKTDQRDAKWLGGFSCFIVAVMALGAARSFTFFWASYSAATRLHNAVLGRVLRAPLAFFHANSAGRILNRFSKDQGVTDDQLPLTFFDALQSSFMVAGSLILVCLVVPWIIPAFVPFIILFFFIRRRYLRASREVKRSDATSRSPLYTRLDSISKGLVTIRAYGASGWFISKVEGDLDANGKWWFTFMGLARWVGFRLDCLSAGTLLVGAVLAMLLRHKVSPQLLGLALSNIINLMGTLQWAVRQSAETENCMTSPERLLEFAHSEREDDTQHTMDDWAPAAHLEFRGVSAAYGIGLDPVLKNISFCLEGGTSCAVVGRTGSGKSSLLLALYRLINIAKGSILLDGVDLLAMSLLSVRGKLAIIPQVPVLFTGTLRFNLDPTGKVDDSRIWSVLESVHLGMAARNLGGLDGPLSGGGKNMSLGQRQLMCLARAILKDAVIIALDEATASIDKGTDALIQASLRDLLASSPQK
ncbi:hypothetical protein CVIRNUC_000127 [Coccomyxa viridis]|uniref:Uncharacterized protein n=1 Tax=Coccomyxa viridis TaxID=1274662 RepID=A0AAV1HPZ5_9CHLO|nr:hypothetical protein CVIRNUC_000127 [Coccomyxa viridis]